MKKLENEVAKLIPEEKIEDNKRNAESCTNGK